MMARIRMAARMMIQNILALIVLALISSMLVNSAIGADAISTDSVSLKVLSNGFSCNTAPPYDCECTSRVSCQFADGRTIPPGGKISVTSLCEISPTISGCVAPSSTSAGTPAEVELRQRYGDFICATDGSYCLCDNSVGCSVDGNTIPDQQSVDACIISKSFRGCTTTPGSGGVAPAGTTGTVESTTSTGPTPTLINGDGPAGIAWTSVACANPRRCQEIDEVWSPSSTSRQWLGISRWIVAASSEIAAKVKEVVSGSWKSFDEVYKSQALGPTTTGTTSVSGGQAIKTANNLDVSCATSYNTNIEWKALLDTIAWAEGTDKYARNNGGVAGYNIYYGGSAFSDLSAHPIETKEKGYLAGPSGGTSAAGRYQFVYATYKALKNNNNLFPNFSPLEQDKAAIHQVEARGINKEQITTAITSSSFDPIWTALAPEWASMPAGTDATSYYAGQPARKRADLKEVFLACYDYYKKLPSGASGVSGTVVDLASAVIPTKIAPGTDIIDFTGANSPNGVSFKAGVEAKGTQPLLNALTTFAQKARELGYTKEIVITDTSREGTSSLHSTGNGVDVRTNDLTLNERLILIKAAIQTGFGEIYHGTKDGSVGLSTSDNQKLSCFWYDAHGDHLHLALETSTQSWESCIKLATVA